MTAMHAVKERPWYREPMVWLVFTLPLLTIPAGLATWWIAAHGSGSNASADDQARRIGQMQFADLGPDLEAARRGLAARATVQADRSRIELAIDGDAGGTLALELQHPADPARDQRVVLETLGGGRWVAQVAPLGTEAWNLRLVSSAGWRLSGRLERGAADFALQPAVEPG
jgi:hypothetical protein